ncbi:MAG: hypothetical protein Q4C47_06660, partial [Planctomycetia bacterium]|nr:hypothetical protein [Planctomycetia bacterium]
PEKTKMSKMYGCGGLSGFRDRNVPDPPEMAARMDFGSTAFPGPFPEKSWGGRRWMWKDGKKMRIVIMTLLSLAMYVTGVPVIAVDQADRVDRSPAPEEPIRHEVRRPQNTSLPPPPGSSGAQPGSTGTQSRTTGAPAFGNLATVGGPAPGNGAATPVTTPTAGGPGTTSPPGTDSGSGGAGARMGAGQVSPGNVAGTGSLRGGPITVGGNSTGGSESGTSRYSFADRTDEIAPPPDAEPENEKKPPEWSHGSLVMFLLISLGLNGYLVWMTLDTRNRYFRLMNDLNGDASREDDEERPRRGTRHQDRESDGRRGGSTTWRSGLNRVRDLSRGAVSRLRPHGDRGTRSRRGDEVDED